MLTLPQMDPSMIHTARQRAALNHIHSVHGTLRIPGDPDIIAISGLATWEELIPASAISQAGGFHSIAALIMKLSQPRQRRTE